MADRSGTQIPWASLAVVAAFVSSTLLVPKAFDLLRPPEKERAQPYSGADLEVDARLWEDPFGAVRRHEAERAERCKAPGAAQLQVCDAKFLAWRRSPQQLKAALKNDTDDRVNDRIDDDSTLMVAVLVPGNPFVGAEESRRRTRYALLSGLQAEGYFPASAEQIGLLEVPRAKLPGREPRAPADARAGAAAPAASAPWTAGGDTLQMPYEVLSQGRNVGGRPGADPADTYRHLAVIWIDESALPTPKMDGVAALLDLVTDCPQPQSCPRLAVIGPSSSDALNVALRGLLDAQMRRNGQPEAPLARGYELLADAHFYSPAATISEHDIPLLQEYGQTLQQFLDAQFTGIVHQRAQRPEAERQVHFVRTIGADDSVARMLAGEVLQRLPVSRPRRIVTIVESDSIYSRGLALNFRSLVEHNPQVSHFEESHFFRGTDGVTLREGSDTKAAAPLPGGTTDAAATVEWPESRNQLDYLRRMADALRRSESIPVDRGGGPIGAIGIFANDVHDKLLLLQALHDTFPDKVFFTTDMDARFVHPRALPFTRNLVVASSLPLSFPPRLPADADRPGWTDDAVQNGTPPLRDAYQTATYLAARLASCRSHCSAVETALQAALATPSVYEISRNRAVAVAGFDAAVQRQQHPSGLTGEALALGLGLVVAALLGWPSTPSLRLARRLWLQWPAAAAARPSEPTPLRTSLLTALYGIWLGYAAASSMEAVAPGSLGLRDALAWAALGGLAASLLSPGLRWLVGPAATAERAFGMQVVSLLLLAGLAGWAVLLTSPAQPGQGEPLLWLEGMSGWPSHFLNLLATLVVLVSLDIHGQRAANTRQADAAWLGYEAQPMQPATLWLAADAPGRVMRRVVQVRDWLQRNSLLAWRLPEPGKVDFGTAWQHWEQLGRPGPRLWRVGFWSVVTLAGAAALFRLLTDNYIPEVPVRGLEHRRLVITGLAAALVALPVLVVAVADATMSACRLMLVLGRGRTRYEPDVVRRFARELGGEHEALLVEAVAADPAQRDGKPPSQAHSLLDDWIDVQVVARATQAVAPLIVAPFIVLALLVMARSRLFDNWALTWPIALTAAAYLLWLVGLSVALKLTAEKLRSRALERMQADLRWLAGAGGGRDKLVEPFKRLIAAVETNTTGAFASTFDQPLVASLMVPLGGAGGVQLLDYLLLAR